MASFTSFARLSHRKERRDSIVDSPDKPHLTPAEFVLSKTVRSAILTAHMDGLTKRQIAAVLDQTLRDYAFQVSIKP